MKDWRTVLEEVREWVWKLQAKPAQSAEAHLMKMLDDARRDWIMAKTYFNTVTEKDLIDHAIFTMDAAEQRYTYLLKKAKAERLRAERLPVA